MTKYLTHKFNDASITVGRCWYSTRVQVSAWAWSFVDGYYNHRDGSMLPVYEVRSYLRGYFIWGEGRFGR